MTPRLTRRRVRAAALAGLLALAAACHRGPDTPAAVPVVADSAALAGTPSAPEPSTIALTIRLPKDRLAAVLDSLTPRRQVAKGQWTYTEQAGVRYAWARQALNVAFRGDSILLGTDVDYQLEVCYRLTDARCWPRVGCGWSDGAFRPPALRGHVALHTRVRLDPAWRLVTETRPSGRGFYYDEANRCRISIARFDATPHVARYLRQTMDSVGRAFDAWVAREADLRARAAELWARAQQPLDLGNGAWLVMAPQAAFAEPVRADADGSLRTTIAIRALPRVVLSETPPAVGAATPLPPLRLQDAPDSLHVALPVHADFAALNAALAASFVGQTVESDGRRYTIRSITAASEGARIRLTVGVEGFFKGTLVLVGTPAFDPATNRLTMPDLDFTLQTGNVLANVGNALRHGAFRQRLRDRTVWELGPQIDTARTRLETWMNRTVAPGVRTRGAISQLRFTGLSVSPDQIHVMLVADGVAAVELAAASS